MQKILPDSVLSGLIVTILGCSGACSPPTPPAAIELPPGLSFPQAFGSVKGLRELSDGRLLVADPLGQALAILDFSAGTADTLGRVGGGPGEYGQPDALFALGGDSTLLVDLGNARLTTLGPDGEFIHTLPMGQQTSGGSPVVALPQGVDREGRLYFRSERTPMGSAPNTTALLRFDPVARQLDTLGTLSIPEPGPPPLPGGGGRRGEALQPQDEWAVGLDGRVAIVRSEDFSMTWSLPDGRLLHGPAVEYDPVEVGEAEKARWLEEKAAQVVMRSDESGTIRVGRGNTPDRTAEAALYDWPSHLPAVRPGGVFVTALGEAWVQRYVAADSPPIIQRFDEDGNTMGMVRLPMSRRLGGFGKESVFLIRVDPTGLEWIERYPLPGDPLSGAGAPSSDTNGACTSFALNSSDESWVGKNLDWELDHGIVVVNERGVLKGSWSGSERPAYSWISRYGSVTFNQLGWGFPLGGINEAGLVVEEMSYSPTRYPPKDQRPAISETQWIQFQLDNHSSVEEVLASDSLIRIEQFLVGLHYLVADQAGNVAVIEFLDGERIVYAGEDLPVPVLANDTYANSVRYLEHHVGFGGERIVSQGPESPERFTRAATLLKNHAEGRVANRPGEVTIQILDSVRQDDTQWSLAYDLGKRAVSFRSTDFPEFRYIALDTLDFTCRDEDVVLPLSDDLPELRRGGGKAWTAEKNGILLEQVFAGLENLLSPERIPSQETQQALVNYPTRARCHGGLVLLSSFMPQP